MTNKVVKGIQNILIILYVYMYELIILRTSAFKMFSALVLERAGKNHLKEGRWKLVVWSEDGEGEREEEM